MCKLILTIVNQKLFVKNCLTKNKKTIKQLFKIGLSYPIKNMSIYNYCFMIINKLQNVYKR